ncbi:hypothetical protein BFR40_00370 [Brochothrix thermosphacta]|uniref:BppU family phage baseplate upper protein n=1 Tax=Brochothrix thermosphacta TaxID=2756 RepID=UPI00083F771E|nr:BppU family phage baseplate upper protein [Brochothrix thermosphacta]ODJ53105.1 hypothetical protein BFR40_00370 [Brochothrix thermosphacta]
MSITKIAKMTTEITADYQKLSDLNVAFYNQDVNTSILQFDVTRNNAPVPLGKVNVDGYIVLLAADGSRIQDAVEITDEINGVIEYTIPREFLKHTGKALGQIYIAVKGKDDTAVMRQFSFDIKDDLLTSFSATKKLEYIKTFDDLTTFIKQRVDEIDEAISNGADYVTAMEKAAEKGQKDIQAVATKTTTDINKVSDDTIKKITDTSNAAVTTVNAKGDEVVKKITDADVVQKRDAFFHTDGKGFSRPVPNGITDWYQISTAGNYSITKTAVPTNAPPIGVYFNLIVNTRTSTTRDLTAISVTTGVIYTNAMTGVDAWSGWKQVANTSDLQSLVKSSEAELWQKQKITNDDGSTIAITNYDLLNTTDVANFDGYVTTAGNAPASSNSGYFKRKYRSGYIEITFSPHSSKEVYRNSYNGVTKNWVGWEKLVTASELAASKPVVLWSGSANGVSSTPYALSRAINTSRKIRVTYDFPGASGKTAVVDLSNTKIFIIHDLNLTDSDANGGGLYEFQLDFTALNKFTIKADTVKDLNGTGKIDQKNITVRKIEEAD